MEANELMIGDWVIHPYYKHPSKIVYFNGSRVRVEYEEVEAESLRPIPLTPEILEKNGFTEIKGAYPTFQIDIYGYLIKVKFPKENKETNNENPFLVIDSRPSYYSSECLYVHELQHVLKLLGIKKEIEL